MGKLLSADLTSANIAKVLEILAGSPGRLEALIGSLPAVKLGQSLGEGERTPIEVLAHLINGEAVSAEMIYQALLVDEPYFADIHPERDWGKLLRFDLLDASELLAYFKIRRKVLVRVLSGLTEAQWGRTVREEGKKRRESVYWRARSLAIHESEHVDDLERKVG